MEPSAVLLIMAPILFPIATQLGISMVVNGGRHTHAAGGPNLFVTAGARAVETARPPPRQAARPQWRPALLLLDEVLSLGRMGKLVYALSYVRGWGICIGTVIQSEAQLCAISGREAAVGFIDAGESVSSVAS